MCHCHCHCQCSGDDCLFSRVMISSMCSLRVPLASTRHFVVSEKAATARRNGGYEGTFCTLDGVWVCTVELTIARFLRHLLAEATGKHLPRLRPSTRRHRLRQLPPILAPPQPTPHQHQLCMSRHRPRFLWGRTRHPSRHARRPSPDPTRRRSRHARCPSCQ